MSVSDSGRTRISVAIIGATGAVGREMINDLEDSKIENLDVGLFASARSAGTNHTFRGKQIEVKAFDLAKVKGYDVALMSAGGKFSKQFAQAICDQGTTVIDNSSAWRMDPKVALVVPEVNSHAISKGLKTARIIANPNCSTIQLVVALQPLREAFGLEMVQVATYQSVSGSGQKGIKELSDQVQAQLRFESYEPHVYAQPVAFNVLPAIDVFTAGGHCFEEEKMIRETCKILEMPTLEVMATTARVPTFHCHCEAVSVLLKKPVSQEQVWEVLAKAPGLKFLQENDHASFPTPRTVTGDRGVWVCRARLPLDKKESRWVQFWVVADNLKKGAATNAVQILEHIVG